MSGRRRNFQPEQTRIDIRPESIKGEILLQVMSNDGRQTTTKNYTPREIDVTALLSSGYANILIEHTQGAMDIRITKKQEALVYFETTPNDQNLEHDRVKARLLDSADPFLRAVGISDSAGNIKPSRQDKYRQVEEFLRVLAPSLSGAIEASHIEKPSENKPLSIVDLGCGHAYLTFAAHQYLTSKAIPVRIVGVDVREESRLRNSAIAKELGIIKTMEFRSEEIKSSTIDHVDVAIALHACDTATDDAIAWAVRNSAKLLLIAPCCHHDLQSQIKQSPEPWGLLTKHGLMKERLADLLTDALRAHILKIIGYRTDVIEFVGGEHTPRNMMIRAVKTSAKPDQFDIDTYHQMLAQWKIKPILAELLEDEINASTQS